MLIECTIRRKAGTTFTFKGVDWKFTPAEDGAHICDVDDDDAIARLLQISEAYRIYRGAAQEPMPPAELAVEKPVTGELPAGASPNVDEMTRDQLFDYAVMLGMKKPHPAIGDDRLRQNIKVFLEMRAGLDDDEPEEQDSTETPETDAEE